MRLTRRHAALATLLVSPLAVACPAEATVYLTVEQALHLAFPTAEAIRPAAVLLTEEQRRRAAALWGRPLPEAGPLTIYTATQGGVVVGRALVLEEIGKYEPITFLVAADANGLVLDVLILVYRESRGGAVRRPQFLKQYQGKTMRDPLRVSRDIVNITGATLSARAISAGVRRALAILTAVP